MLLLCAPRASAKWEGEGSADGRRSRRGVLPSVVPARFALSPRLHTHRHRRSCRRACRMPPSPSAEAARDPRGPAAGQRGSATHAAGCHPPPQRHGVVEPGGSSRLSQAQVRLKPAQKHRGSNLSGSSPAQVRLGSNWLGSSPAQVPCGRDLSRLKSGSSPPRRAPRKRSAQVEPSSL